MDDEAVWERATSRRRRSYRNENVHRSAKSFTDRALSSNDNFDDDDDLETIRRKFRTARFRFSPNGSSHAFVNKLLADLASAFRPRSGPQSIDILCLGLGNLAVDRTSLQQLALLDVLIELDDRFDRSRTQLYDPVFRSTARQFIHELGMQVLETNREARYVLSPDRFHLVVLPHCCPILLNNLLEANWSVTTLSRLVLFSNGWHEVFNELTESGETAKSIAEALTYIKALEPVLIVGKSLSCAKVSDAEPDFEGMRVQWFQTNSLNTLPLCSSMDRQLTSSSKLYDLIPEKLAKEPSILYSDFIKADHVPSFVDSEETPA